MVYFIIGFVVALLGNIFFKKVNKNKHKTVSCNDGRGERYAAFSGNFIRGACEGQALRGDGADPAEHPDKPAHPAGESSFDAGVSGRTPRGGKGAGGYGGNPDRPLSSGNPGPGQISTKRRRSLLGRNRALLTAAKPVPGAEKRSGRQGDCG